LLDEARFKSSMTLPNQDIYILNHGEFVAKHQLVQIKTVYGKGFLKRI